MIGTDDATDDPFARKGIRPSWGRMVVTDKAAAHPFGDRRFISVGPPSR
jgi:hypothetical protein